MNRNIRCLITMLIVQIVIISCPLIAGEWIHFRTIPFGTVPVHAYAGNIIIAGFSDGIHGIAIGPPHEVHYTNDGGKSWIPTEVPNVSHLTSIEILDTSNIWVGSGLYTRYSPNGGISWKELPAYGSIYSSGHYLSFINPKTGWYGICKGGTTPTLARTSDGGGNWIPISTPPEVVDNLWAINLVSSDTGFLLLYDGSVYRTGNGGITWNRSGALPFKNRLIQNTTYGSQTDASIRFTDEKNGIAVIFCLKPRGYCSFSTSDGGHEWIEEKMPDKTTSFFGSVFLSRDGNYLTITDLENGSIVICTRAMQKLKSP